MSILDTSNAQPVVRNELTFLMALFRYSLDDLWANLLQKSALGTSTAEIETAEEAVEEGQIYRK